MKLKFIIITLFILISMLLFSDTIIDTLYSIPNLDGGITYDWDSHIFFYNTGDTSFHVGDHGWSGYGTARGYLSFELPDIPDGYELQHAEIFIEQYHSIGNDVGGVFPIWDVNPLPDTLGCVVDHINYGNQLTPYDWTAGDPGDAQTLNSNISVISENAEYEFKNLEVTTSVLEDYNSNRDKTQYRLRFLIDNDWDDHDDLLRFHSGNAYDSDCPYILYTWWDGVNNSDNNELSNTNYELNVYPNPFNGSVTISYSIINQDAENTILEVFNIKGQKIDTLTPSLCQPELVEGRGEVIWNAQNQTSGIYLIKISNSEQKYVKKITYLK